MWNSSVMLQRDYTITFVRIGLLPDDIYVSLSSDKWTLPFPPQVLNVKKNECFLFLNVGSCVEKFCKWAFFKRVQPRYAHCISVKGIVCFLFCTVKWWWSCFLYFSPRMLLLACSVVGRFGFGCFGSWEWPCAWLFPILKKTTTSERFNTEHLIKETQRNNPIVLTSQSSVLLAETWI